MDSSINLNNLEKKRLGIALQGGGAYGAFTWGVLDRLLEIDELVAEGIVGTSAGAVNAIVTAYGLHIGGKEEARRLLEKLWKKISLTSNPFYKPSFFDSFFSGGDMYNSPGYLFMSSLTQNFSPYQLNPANINPLKEILSSIVDFDELRKYNTKKLFICATNVKTNRARVFSNEEITLDTVLASTCLPNLFQSVEIDGEFYWDGGFMGNPPLFPLIEETNINDILLVKLNSINIDQIPQNAIDIENRVAEISFNSSLISEMKMINFRNELIRNGINLEKFKQNKEVYIHLISSHEVTRNLKYSSKLNTSWDFLLYLKEKGREYTDLWINNEYDKVGKSSSFDIEKNFFNKFK